MIKVDGAPRQSDHLSLTEPENQDQHVRGVPRITIPLCRLQEAPRLISGQGGAAARRQVRRSPRRALALGEAPPGAPAPSQPIQYHLSGRIIRHAS